MSKPQLHEQVSRAGKTAFAPGWEVKLHSGSVPLTELFIVWIWVAILFFLHKLSRSNWGKMSISGSPHSKIVTVHSSLKVRMKKNMRKPDKQTLNYLDLSETTPSAEKVSSRENRKLMRYALTCPKPWKSQQLKCHSWNLLPLQAEGWCIHGEGAMGQQQWCYGKDTRGWQWDGVSAVKSLQFPRRAT